MEIKKFIVQRDYEVQGTYNQIRRGNQAPAGRIKNPGSRIVREGAA